MRIEAGGNVGIGTTSNLKGKVEISGTANSTLLTLQGNLGDGQYQEISFAGQYRNYASIRGGVYNYSGDQGFLAFYVTEDNDNLEEVMRLVNYDNDDIRVGIGTTAPADLLHLSSSGHTEMSLDRATTGYDASIKFRTGGTTNWNFGTGITGTESDLTFNDGSDHVLILKSDNSATFAGGVYMDGGGAESERDLGKIKNDVIYGALHAHYTS